MPKIQSYEDFVDRRRKYRELASGLIDNKTFTCYQSDGGQWMVTMHDANIFHVWISVYANEVVQFDTLDQNKFIGYKASRPDWVDGL